MAFPNICRIIAFVIWVVGLKRVCRSTVGKVVKLNLIPRSSYSRKLIVCRQNIAAIRKRSTQYCRWTLRNHYQITVWSPLASFVQHVWHEQELTCRHTRKKKYNMYSYHVIIIAWLSAVIINNNNLMMTTMMMETYTKMPINELIIHPSYKQMFSKCKTEKIDYT